MPRKSRIVRKAAATRTMPWRAPLAAAIMGLVLLGLGRCAGRSVDLEAASRGGSVAVSAAGVETWAQFFACYPVPDTYMRLAIMRQYEQDGDLAPPPPVVRIPLAPEGDQASAKDAAWMASLRTGASGCPSGLS